MKYIALLIFLLCGLIFYLFPYIKKERVCYDSAFEFVRRERINTPSRGTDLKEVCRARVEMIAVLKECSNTAETSNSVTGLFRSLIAYGASFDHPFSKNSKVFTADHNAQCVDYPQFQFR